MPHRLSPINSQVHGRRDYNINDVQIHFGELCREYFLLNLDQVPALVEVILVACCKSEGIDSCDRPSNFTQTGFKSAIFQPV